MNRVQDWIFNVRGKKAENQKPTESCLGLFHPWQLLTIISWCSFFVAHNVQSLFYVLRESCICCQEIISLRNEKHLFECKSCFGFLLSLNIRTFFKRKIIFFCINVSGIFSVQKEAKFNKRFFCWFLDDVLLRFHQIGAVWMWSKTFKCKSISKRMTYGLTKERNHCKRWLNS